MTDIHILPALNLLEYVSEYGVILLEVVKSGKWLTKLHADLVALDAQQSIEYKAKFKRLSLLLIRCTEFIKSKRPSSENSTVVNTVLNFGGELLFHEAKVEDLQQQLRYAQNDLHGEVTLIILDLLKSNTAKLDLKSLLPDLFECFRADINQHLSEFKAGSRGWLFDVC